MSTDVSEEHFVPIFRVQSRKISEARNLLETGGKQSSCLAYSLTLKMEVKYSSKTLVDFQWTT
jgi:hypothetical protein